MRAFLFLPKNASPPYQTVIFFPAGDAFVLRSSRDLSLVRVSFLIPTGRAFLYSVYKGTYERTMRGREISAAPSTTSKRDRTSIGLVSRSTV